MERTGWLQIFILFQSLPWGIVIGFIFDLNCGTIRSSKKRITAFLIDAMFGVIAAIITFFCALVILDGQIHPFLLGGILLGFLFEHYTLGKILSLCVFKICSLVTQLIKKLSRKSNGLKTLIAKNLKKIQPNRPITIKFKKNFHKIKENS